MFLAKSIDGHIFKFQENIIEISYFLFSTYFLSHFSFSFLLTQMNLDAINLI